MPGGDFRSVAKKIQPARPLTTHQEYNVLGSCGSICRKGLFTFYSLTVYALVTVERWNVKRLAYLIEQAFGFGYPVTENRFESLVSA